MDAAIATGFCLAVIEPWNSSIAGHGQMIVHMAAEGRSIAIDYGHSAPGAATPDMFRVTGQTVVGNGIYEVEGRANAVGHLSVGVPGVTAGMCRAHELFGSLPLERLVEPAAHYAREGFEADVTTCLMGGTFMSKLVGHPEAVRVFLPDGYPPAPGTRVVQRDLAGTLERIGREGKDALHRGEVAAAIDEEMRRNGGVLSAQDLAGYEAQVLEPARTSYRGYELLGSPAPGGTITTLQTLNIMESFDLARLSHGSPEHLHLFIESARHAFADRYSFAGDPDFAPVPLDGMLSREYAREIAGTIDREKAGLEDEREVQPWVAYADKPLHDPWRHDPQPRPEGRVHRIAPKRGRLHHSPERHRPGQEHGVLHADRRGGLRLRSRRARHRRAPRQRHDRLQPDARLGQLDSRIQARAEQHGARADAQGRASPSSPSERPAGARSCAASRTSSPTWSTSAWECRRRLPRPASTPPSARPSSTTGSTRGLWRRWRAWATTSRWCRSPPPEAASPGPAA